MKNIKKILDLVDNVRDQIVPCFLGEPGISKTRQIYQWAEAHDRNVVEIIASQILPNEVSGITMPDTETKSMEIFDHARLSSLKDGDILFFDELLQAAPTTLAACLTLIQERRLMSGKKLPDIMIVAAANPTANLCRFEGSIAQRFLWIYTQFDEDIWWNWYCENYGIDNAGAKQIKSICQAIASQGVPSTGVTQVMKLNVLTPRTVCKLTDMWIKNDYDPLVCELILYNFKASVADALVKGLRKLRDYKCDKIMDIRCLKAVKSLALEMISSECGHEPITYLTTDSNGEVLRHFSAEDDINKCDSIEEIKNILEDLHIDWNELLKQAKDKEM